MKCSVSTCHKEWKEYSAHMGTEKVPSSYTECPVCRQLFCNMHLTSLHSVSRRGITITTEYKPAVCINCCPKITVSFKHDIE